MAFIEFKYQNESDVKREIIMADLADLGYDTFSEDADVLLAYKKGDDLKSEEEFLKKNLENSIKFELKLIQEENWNAQWESNFESIEIDQRIYIRADFHEAKPHFEFEIVINPKMSFGTGHHQTTYLILQELLSMDIIGKDVLDMGCGSGILGIFASKKGANSVDYIDIDEWPVENTKENLLRNNCQGEVLLGGAEKIPSKNYDLILANINKIILLEDMKEYCLRMQAGSQILFSGFYESDLEDIKNEAEKNGLVFSFSNSKEKWCMAKFMKS